MVRALREVRASAVRLNTDDLLTDWTFRWTTESAHFESADLAFAPSEVSAVYYRRAYSPRPPHSASSDAAEFIIREGRTVLRALYSSLSCPWISHHAAIAAAENKPYQLSMAERMGFNVPRTLVTNAPDSARDFARRVGPVVLKALSRGELGAGMVLHTTLIDKWSDEYEADIGVAPHLLQSFVEKAWDYRVTVVDENIFACRIDSQSFPEYAVDMRRGLADDRMHHDIVELPAEVSELCVEIVRRLGLRFGAIDLIEDRSGKYWFLEINPNGQWAWIQDRTGAPIAEAIASGLIAGG